MERKELLLRKNKRNMKEEKISAYVKDLGNPPCSDCVKAPQTLGGLRFSDLLFEIGFGIASAAHLLVSTLAVICQSYSITNGTVCNEMVNICALFGAVI